MLSLIEVQERLAKLDNWNVEFNSILKDFKFASFIEAKFFTDKIAALAEKKSHFPTITWNNLNVRVNLSTPSQNTLTEADFNFAEEIDKIYKQ